MFQGRVETGVGAGELQLYWSIRLLTAVLLFVSVLLLNWGTHGGDP